MYDLGSRETNQRANKRLKMRETPNTETYVTTRPQVEPHGTHPKEDPNGKETPTGNNPTQSSNTTQKETPPEVTPTPAESHQKTQGGDMSPQDPTDRSGGNTNTQLNKPDTNTPHHQK